MNHTHETAPTQFVSAGGVRYAYRRFGKSGGAPLLFLGYFNSNMDGWDPIVTNGLAADHEIVLFDNAGIAGSSGETPSTVEEMTERCVAFCHALEFGSVNVVGFSLGGMIAQQLALDQPSLLNRIILLGTGPRGGEGLTFTELSPEEQADPIGFLMAAFFTTSEAGIAAGKAFVERLKSRKDDRDSRVSKESATAQISAIRDWGLIPSSDRYATLARIKHRILIVHGSKDVVVSPINALLLEEHLPDAQLIVYPDSSHGTQYQHADLFLKHVKIFLSE